jgi:hypothetical protein
MEQMVFVPIAPCIFICRSEPTCEGRDIITLFGELHIFFPKCNIPSQLSRQSVSMVSVSQHFLSLSFYLYVSTYKYIMALYLYTAIFSCSYYGWMNFIWNDLEKQKQVQGVIFGGSLTFLFHFCFNIALIDILNLLLSFFSPSEMLRDR